MTSDIGIRAPERMRGGEMSAPVLCFVRDRDSEGLIRQSLTDLGVANPEFIDGDVNSAIDQLPKRYSPRLLIVDVSGVDDPVGHMARLFDVCEPATGVVAIGDRNDITLYRQLKDAGVVEYYFKPLVSNLVRQTCNAILTGTVEKPSTRIGKLLFVLGARGGVGATTVAVSTAWQLSKTRPRQVILLDLDLYSGDSALQLDVRPSHALVEALEHPDRVDDLFLERGLIQVTDRLSVLASLEPFTGLFVPDEEAVLSILANLLQRFRYVVVDLPAILAAAMPRVLHLPSTCLLVSDGNLASARDIARWREAIGPNSPERSTLHLLNKAGVHGNLPSEEFVRAAGQEPDFVVRYDRDINDTAIAGVRGVQKSTALSQGLMPLYQLLTGERVSEPGSLFKRMFG